MSESPRPTARRLASDPSPQTATTRSHNHRSSKDGTPRDQPQDPCRVSDFILNGLPPQAETEAPEALSPDLRQEPVALQRGGDDANPLPGTRQITVATHQLQFKIA